LLACDQIRITFYMRKLIYTSRKLPHTTGTSDYI
jgi:hypothetical protein